MIKLKVALAGMALAMAAQPAHAKRLYSIWNLVPQGEQGDLAGTTKLPIFEQSLVPARAVRLTADAVTDTGKTIAAGTELFRVVEETGKSAFCTVKDRSAGNAAKSLFIPALDKRPCLMDTDNDGIFDVSFNVFDKYGSALTPSGNLSKAKGLKQVAAYEQMDATKFSAGYRMTFRIYGKPDLSKLGVAVALDKGTGKAEEGVARTERVGNTIMAMNGRFTVNSITDDRVLADVKVDPSVVLVGDSNGGMAVVSRLPAFLGD